ncbi:Dihydroorotase [Smittium culicis]|uniref:Dihydroorotase n=1 Tax=Smittium culicis TaxID=133412 RepID=A0A1R1XK23_9FUNG|nr:Dihydroorotase [Smittium culicis]
MSFDKFWVHEPELSTSQQGDIISVPKISDLHCHLRQGPMLESMVPLVAQGGADTILVMPNLIPPLVNTDQVVEYRNQILSIDPSLNLLMTIYFNKDLTKEELIKAKQNGIAGVKLYPFGVTTNSQYGINDLSEYSHIFKAIEDTGLVLNLHGECPSTVPNSCVLNAEELFLDTLKWLATTFPALKIVLEHATTNAAVECVLSLNNNIACSITPHHLLITIDDWCQNSHNYCKPVAKYPTDRSALRKVVSQGHPKFFLGSDSAPHPQSSKTTNSPAAGVFTSPILLPLLASIFDKLGCLDNLQKFAYYNGRSFYGLDTSSPSLVKLAKLPSKVPHIYNTLLPTKTQSGSISDNGVVPFLADLDLPWKFVE